MGFSNYLFFLFLFIKLPFFSRSPPAMSSSITTVGGVVVITQVLPRGESAMAMQVTAAGTTSDTTAAQPATPPASTPPALDSSLKVNDMTTTFLRGHPHGLGVRTGYHR